MAFTTGSFNWNPNQGGQAPTLYSIFGNQQQPQYPSLPTNASWSSPSPQSQSQQQSVQGSQSTQQSGQYFQNPSLVGAVSGNLGGVQQQAGQNYMNFINDPTSHPYFSNALSGLLQALVPSENAARMNLNDTFRAAGNTASSTFGDKAVGLESELMRNRMGTASQLLTQMFPQIASALYNPLSQTSSLIDALKMNQSSGQSSSFGQSSGSSVGMGNQPRSWQYTHDGSLQFL
jgi:hypothetical protein